MPAAAPSSPYALLALLLAPLTSMVIGCAGEGARPALIDESAAERSVVVLFPRSACSGASRTVLTDREGAFLAAVAPGEATRIALPPSTKGVYAFSSAELAASPGSVPRVHAVTVDPLPPALVVEARECPSREQAVHPVTAGALSAELAQEDVLWVSPRVEQGQLWLASHQARLSEILAPTRSAMP